MTARRDGFTIVEVLIAVVMLGLGLLVLAGGAGGVTRMISNGQRKTRSYTAASTVLETLRNTAKTSCGSLAAGTSTSQGGIAVSWSVGSAGSTSTPHLVRIITSYRVGPRTLGDTLISTLYC